MAIRGEDNRSIVTNFNVDGIDAVVGIDFKRPVLADNSEVVTNVSTGNLVSPYHVLTAGHVISDISDASEAKVRLVENAASINSRARTSISSGNFDASGTNLNYPVSGYNGDTGGDDLGLITLNELIGEPSQYIGLATFVDSKDVEDLQVTTAGFPGAVDRKDFASNEDGTVNLAESISKNAPFLITDENGIPSESLSRPSGVSFLTDAVELFTATGTIDDVNSEGRFSLDQTLDAEQGQSGSGYWTYLEGDSEPRVLGVYSEGGDTLAGGLLDDNYGALITTEAYDNIVATMQPLLDANNLTGNDLPENAIVGSNVSDEIEGSYRKERILGNAGQDTISGGDADDRLEGGFGNDTLDGGKGNDRLQGDNNNDYLDGGEGNIDVAVFSEEYTTENYDYSISEDGEEITISHIGGTRNDGVDTLKNIEWGLFKSGAEDLDNLSSLSLNEEGESITEVAAATGSAPRIIPLPLEDGVATPDFVDVIDPNPDPFSNDPVTPPNLSLTAPVSMLDGDIDYTLNISPYQPDREYNIAYIIDTSLSFDPVAFQEVKDAYIELTNYFIEQELADNINFGVISFDKQAAIQLDSHNERSLTASEAITAIALLSL